MKWRGAAAVLLAGGATLVASAPAGAENAYVAQGSSPGGLISQFSVGEGGLLAPLDPPSVGAGNVPANGALTPDGKHLFFTNFGSDSVSQFNVAADGKLEPKTPATVGAGDGPEEAAVSPDGGDLYVNNVGGGISQYTIAATAGTLAPKGTPIVNSGTTYLSVAVSPDGEDVYATTNTDLLVRFSVGPDGSLTQAEAVNLGGDGEHIALTPDGSSLYVVNEDTDNVHQFTVGTGGTLLAKDPATLPAGNVPQRVAVSPSGAGLYVTNSNGVRQYTIGTGGRLAAKDPAEVAVAGAASVALTPDGHSAYVSTGSASTVAQFDVGASGLLAPKDPATVAVPDALGIATSPNQGPTASFVAGPFIAGLGTVFGGFPSTDPEDGNELARYDWVWGDGTSSANAGPVPKHVYRNPGTYTARLTVTDEQGCSTQRVFTGQTAYCNGGPQATTTRTFTVRPQSAPSGPGGAFTPPAVEGRRTPRSLSLGVRPRRDRRAPYRFRVSGRLRLPSGVTRAQGCRGRVSLRIRRGRRVSLKLVRLSSRCTFSRRLNLRPRSGRLSIRGRFRGNDTLVPRRSRALGLRAG